MSELQPSQRGVFFVCPYCPNEPLSIGGDMLKCEGSCGRSFEKPSEPTVLDDADIATLREILDWATTGMGEMEVGDAERDENEALTARAVAVLSKITGAPEETPAARWTRVALEAYKKHTG